MDGSEGEKGKKGGDDEEEDEANTRNQQKETNAENVDSRKTSVTVQKPKDLPLKNIAPSTAAEIQKSKQSVASSKIKTKIEPPIPPKRRETSAKVSTIRKEPSPKRVSAEPKSPLAPRRSAELCPRHGGSQESLKDVGIKKEDRRGGKSPVTPTRQSSDSSVRASSKSPDPKLRKDSPGTKRKATGKKEDSPKKLATSPKPKAQGREHDVSRADGASSIGKTENTQKLKSDKKVPEKTPIKPKSVQPKSPSSQSHITSKKSPVNQSGNLNIEGNEMEGSASSGSAEVSTTDEKNLQPKEKAKDLLKQETQLLKEALKLPPASDAIGVKKMNQAVTSKVTRDSKPKPVIPGMKDSEVPCVSKNVEDKHRHDKSPKASDIEKLHDILTEKSNISVKEMLTLKNSTIQEQTKELATTSRKEKRTQSEGSTKLHDPNLASKRTPLKNEPPIHSTDVKNSNTRSGAEMGVNEFSDESLTLERKLKDDQNNSIKGFPHAPVSQTDKEISNASKIAFDSVVSKSKKVSTGFMRAQSIAGIEVSERGKLMDSDKKNTGDDPLIQKSCNVRKGSLDTQDVRLSKKFAGSITREGKINNQLQKTLDQRSALTIARGHINERNGGSGQQNEKSSMQSCKLISSESIPRVRTDENEKLQSDKDSLGCGGLQGRKCPIYFGVKSYLHQFYDSAPSKDPNYDYYEDEDDFEYMVDPSKRQKPCCCQGLWFRVGLWGGANLLLIGVIALLVGHLTPPRQTVVAFEDDLEVLDRWAIAFNHRLELCRLAGLAVFCCGGVVLLTTLLLSTITHARRETNIIRHMAPLVEPYDAIPTAAKIPITEKIRQVQPSLWPETAGSRDGGLVQVP